MRTRSDIHRTVGRLSAIVATFGILTAPHALAAGQAALGGEPTFTKDIAPILQRSCQTCHRSGGMAPMSLVTYQEARPWARAIKLRTSVREMPPWFIERNIGIQGYRDDPSLSDEEIATIARWADSGAPPGDPGDMPPPLKFTDGGEWSFGTPDLVLSTPVIVVPAFAADWQADFATLPIGLTEDRYVQAVQVRETRLREEAVDSALTGPRADLNISVIHHANFQARTDFDAENDNPSNGIGRDVGYFSLVHELGQNATIYPDDLGVVLPANGLVSVRVHTHANGKDTDVRLDLGFKLHPEGYQPKYVVRGGTSLANFDLDIPAGEDNVRMDAYSVLKTPAKFLTFEPHMHASGKRMCTQAIYPSGIRQTLSCAGYNHNWVRVYVYEDDVAPLLPAGTILQVIGWYDNSAKNPRNPEPRNWKGFGNRSIDDMMFDLGKYIALTEEEFQAEVAARQAKRSKSTNN